MASGNFPLIGHTIAFLRDGAKLCFDKKDKHGSLFALNIAGNRFNIITDYVSGTEKWIFDITIANNLGINFFYKNDKTFVSDLFFDRFNDYVCLSSDKYNEDSKFRENLEKRLSMFLKIKLIEC